MKKIILIIALATAAINLFSQEEKMYVMKNGNMRYQSVVSDIDSIIFYTPACIIDTGVVINGVKWATRNVDEPGNFAATAESAGKIYQWNRIKAWDAVTVNVTGWDASNATGTSWETENDPSPEGWRVPLQAELNSLLDAEKVTNEWVTSPVNGRRFTDIASGNTLFLPAAGYRDGSDGTLNYAGTYGYYWSSTANGTTSAYGLDFRSNSTNMNISGRRYGYCVRAVAAE
ncbi:hypothetical protein FACS1894178_5500 [Bacteroidia bacterium]|nr:hypothetical protein FACS1894178_5500 [Bacteroidia bacterium]